MRIGIYFALFLVLLIVPTLLSACKGRTVLDGDKTKRVSGSLVAPGKPADAGTDSSGLIAAVPDESIAHGVADVHVPLSQKSIVWFTKVEGEKTVKIPEFCPPPPSLEKKAALRYVVELLLAGPKGGYATEVPAGTKLLDVQENPDHSFIVDLSSQFVHGGGMDSFEARIEQLRRTVRGVITDQPVYLYVDGHKLEASGEGQEVQQPVNGPGSAAGTADENGQDAGKPAPN